jgi:hypothetical protein
MILQTLKRRWLCFRYFRHVRERCIFFYVWCLQFLKFAFFILAMVYEKGWKQFMREKFRFGINHIYWWTKERAFLDFILILSLTEVAEERRTFSTCQNIKINYIDLFVKMFESHSTIGFKHIIITIKPLCKTDSINKQLMYG